MDEHQVSRSASLDHELIEPLGRAATETSSTACWSIALVLFPAVPRFRSPIMESRAVIPVPADRDQPGLTVPAARDVIRPVGWALLVAIPVLFIVGWQLALLLGVASAIVRAVDGLIGRSNLSFADGFIGFRTEAAWPKGVREDDDVRWNWSNIGNGQAAHS